MKEGSKKGSTKADKGERPKEKAATNVCNATQRQKLCVDSTAREQYAPGAAKTATGNTELDDAQGSR